MSHRQGGVGETPTRSLSVSEVEATISDGRASLRNSKPLKAPDLRRLEVENQKLKAVVLTQSLMISELTKEMNWD